MTVCMQALVTKHGGEVPGALLSRVVEELVGLISDADLVVAAMSLRLCATLLMQQPSCAPTISASALPPAMALLQSQLLQVCPLPPQVPAQCKCRMLQQLPSDKQGQLRPDRALEHPLCCQPTVAQVVRACCIFFRSF